MEGFLKKLKPSKIRPSEYLKTIKVAKEYARTNPIVFSEKDYQEMNPEINKKFKLLL